MGLAYPCTKCACRDFDDATGLAPEHARAHVTTSAYGVSDIIEELVDARAENRRLRALLENVSGQLTGLSLNLNPANRPGHVEYINKAGAVKWIDGLSSEIRAALAATKD